MQINDSSVGFHTNKVEECRDFYVKYFGAKVTFDCGWYVTVKLGGESRPQLLNFMQPQTEGEPLFTGGLSVFLEVVTEQEVNAEYERLAKEGLSLTPPEDHEWGDRAFTLFDPIGTTLYVFAYKPMSEKYADAIKK